MNNLSENNPLQTAKRFCSPQSFSWHILRRCEFAELCFGKIDAVSGSRLLCIVSCCSALFVQ